MLTDVTNIQTYRKGGIHNGAVRPLPQSVLNQKQFWQQQDQKMGRLIRRAARGQNCSLRLQGCRNDPATVVFAHAPSIDNGMGLKQAKDFWGAFACSHCHDIVDGRVSTKDDRITILERWLAGIYETQKKLIELGLIHYEDSLQSRHTSGHPTGTDVRDAGSS